MKRRVLLATPLLLATSGHLLAQSDFPSRPLRIIVPLSPGGIFDVIARSLADELGRQLNVPTIVENKPGGQFAIGLQAISSAKPDGYTIGLVSIGMLTQMPALYPSLPYKLEDFQAVAPLADFRSVLVVPASSPVRSLADYVAWSTASKSPVLLGITGLGGTPHLMVELLAKAANFTVEPVAFPGEPAAVQALLGGHVPAAALSLANVIEHERTGKLKIIAFSGEKRHPAIPATPTFMESGFSGVKGFSLVGIFAPRGTPAPIVERLNGAIARATQQARFKERLPIDMEPLSTTAKELQELAAKLGPHHRGARLAHEGEIVTAQLARVVVFDSVGATPAT